MKHFLLPVGFSLLILSACNAQEGDRANDAACAVAVTKTLPLLPEGINVDVAKIEAGRSGSALSCKVTGQLDNIMIDASVTCMGGADQLMACTEIESVHTLDGDMIYP